MAKKYGIIEEMLFSRIQFNSNLRLKLHVDVILHCVTYRYVGMVWYTVRMCSEFRI